jgi:hypothetical protein
MRSFASRQTSTCADVEAHERLILRHRSWIQVANVPFVANVECHVDKTMPDAAGGHIPGRQDSI